MHFLADEPQYLNHSIGHYTYGVKSPLILSNTTGEKSGALKIGKFCSIASGVTILLGGEHRLDWVTTYPFSRIFNKYKKLSEDSATKGDVVIGNDVWIGMDVLVLSGVTIGDGAVVGAGSVVAKDVDPYAIVAGNPARLIRKRFDDDVIRKLLKIKWWDWDAKRLNENMPFILSNDIKGFIERNQAA